MRRELFDSSVGAMLQEVVSRHENRPAMRHYRQGGWQSFTWGEFGKRLKSLGLGFIDLGLQPGECFAILGPNEPEWVLSDVALASIGVVTVPLYPTLDLETMLLIIKDSGCRGVVAIGDAAVERAEQLTNKLKRGKDEWLVVAADSAAPKASRLSFQALLEKGERQTDKRPFYARLETLTPESLFTIIYTSGTTGQPKGVMLSHRNFMSNVGASVRRFGLREAQEVYLSLLPLSHAYERHCHYVFMSIGSELTYARGFDKLGDDLLGIEPTIFAAVPRVFEKFHAKVMEAASHRPAVSRYLFNWAVRRGRRGLESGGSGIGYSIAKSVVLNKIKARLGSRLRFVVSGGGTLNPDLARFFNAAGVRLAEGYGLTEASPIISCNPPEAIKIGTVGKVYPNLEARLSERGELLVRGPSVAMGYYNRPQETAATFDAEGWLHTGDQASFDADGYLTITGRFKDVIKTAGGKMVAPQKLIERFSELAWCDQICILGEGKPYLVALIVPQEHGLQRRVDAEAAKAGKRGKGEPKETRPLAELILDEKVWEMLESDVESINSGLSPFETVKRFALLPQAFSEAAGTMTPTFKIKRHAVLEQYAELYELLYGDRSQVWNGDDHGKIPLLPRKFER